MHRGGICAQLAAAQSVNPTPTRKADDVDVAGVMPKLCWVGSHHRYPCRATTVKSEPSTLRLPSGLPVFNFDVFHNEQEPKRCCFSPYCMHVLVGKIKVEPLCLPRSAGLRVGAWPQCSDRSDHFLLRKNRLSVAKGLTDTNTKRPSSV